MRKAPGGGVLQKETPEPRGAPARKRRDVGGPSIAFREMETGGSPRDSCCLYVGDMIPLPFAHSASASADFHARPTNNRSDDRGMHKSQSAGEGKCRGRRTKSWFRFASRPGAKKGRKESANRGRRAGTASQVQGPRRPGRDRARGFHRTWCRRVDTHGPCLDPDLGAPIGHCTFCLLVKKMFKN